MIGTEKATGGAERKKPYVSCIRLNGVPILPPLMDQRTKSMSIEAKKRALQLEMKLGWTSRYQEQSYAKKLVVEERGHSGSSSMQNGVGGRGDKKIDVSPQCTCGGKERPNFSRRFTSVPCLMDGSLNTVSWRLQMYTSSVSRSSIFPFSLYSRSAKSLRKCNSVESLQVREQYENKLPPDCPRCGRSGEPDRASGKGPLPSERHRAGNSKAPAKARDWNRSQIAYVKGGGMASAESELSLTSLSPQKCDLTRESNNSASDSTWAVGFYRQLFPLENGENRNFNSDSSDEDIGRHLRGRGSERGSRSASSDYVSARESSAALLEVPTGPGADDGRSVGYRLVRQGSYVLEKPSEALLDHLKRQNTSVGDTVLYRPVRPMKESSVQTEIDEFDLSDDEDDGEDLETSSKVSLLREKLRKRFDAAMEALLVKQRAEQEALARAFLQVQQSARLQMKASAVINAAARGYLIRRLMRTKHVQDLIETMEESLKCIFELKGESLRPLRADQELYDRLLQQLTAACTTFYETFFEISTAERMKIIAADRERLKYLQLKAASLGLHSTRPSMR